MCISTHKTITSVLTFREVILSTRRLVQEMKMEEAELSENVVRDGLSSFRMYVFTLIRHQNISLQKDLILYISNSFNIATTLTISWLTIRLAIMSVISCKIRKCSNVWCTTNEKEGLTSLVQ